MKEGRVTRSRSIKYQRAGLFCLTCSSRSVGYYRDNDMGDERRGCAPVATVGSVGMVDMIGMIGVITHDAAPG